MTDAPAHPAARPRPGTPGNPYRLTAEDEAALLAGAPWRRLAVIGDSIAEGVGEPTEGFPDQGWAATLADALRRTTPGLAYLNLGTRDQRADEIRATQLALALAFDPDLAVVVAGGNDLLRGRFDIEPVAGHIEAIVRALRETGADVVTVGLYDCAGSPYIPEELRAPLTARLHELNNRTWEIALDHGAIHLDFTNDPGSADPSLYGSDGLHGNRRGHAYTAAVAVRTLGARLGNRR
ncbi:SGNH/GDSL hydrolase family protein [Yinghuangia sp. ASG 101]|uniref:SGNH/GDSL hydrolase family protein n=1 Tax=Yinghuangia sp. ASG 101 TaxID=2896848 RepID=UPI001E58907F|nr:SGNH/GDSL hydrolase family protein [Yinghuangia sp. ASG 101]UGQ12872.1 SGNH/GDSL hydrolase family protein [Yinghuangia sp. ASG 101]